MSVEDIEAVVNEFSETKNDVDSPYPQKSEWVFFVEVVPSYQGAPGAYQGKDKQWYRDAAYFNKDVFENAYYNASLPGKGGMAAFNLDGEVVIYEAPKPFTDISTLPAELVEIYNNNPTERFRLQDIKHVVAFHRGDNEYGSDDCYTAAMIVLHDDSVWYGEGYQLDQGEDGWNTSTFCWYSDDTLEAAIYYADSELLKESLRLQLAIHKAKQLLKERGQDVG